MPLLILHGDADSTVPPERSLQLKQILDEQKVTNERKVYPGEGHNITRTQATDLRARLVAWLRTHAVLK